MYINENVHVYIPTISFSLSTMTENNTIILKNKRIYNFYKNNPSISFEETNYFMVDLLEKMMQTSQPNLDYNLASKLLEQMNKVHSDITQSQSKVQMLLIERLNEMKKDYLKDIELVLSNNNTEKLSPLLQQQSSVLEDKVRIILQDVLPKTQTTIKHDLETSLKTLYQSVQEETNQLLEKSIDKKTLEELANTIDNKFAKSLVSSQTFLNNMISSTEQRINKTLGDGQSLTVTGMQSIENTINNTQYEQKSLQQNVSDLLRKMDNSSAKGKISENLLQHILHGAYPSAQVDFVGTAKETGDILMYRQNKPTILFENKNYERNVGQDEVKKFIRDIEVQQCSGILCAQNYGIANKDNYQIDIHNGHVLVYVHKMDYDPERLKIAVDMIDHFTRTMEGLELGSESFQLDKPVLQEINKEYQSFIQSKANQIKMVKEYNQKLLTQLDEWKLPQLEALLSKFFITAVAKENVCDYCNYIAKNPRALIAHHRGCTEKKRALSMAIEIHTGGGNK